MPSTPKSNLAVILTKYVDPTTAAKIVQDVKTYKRNWRKWNIYPTEEQVEAIRKMFPDLKMVEANPPSPLPTKKKKRAG